MSRNYGLGSRDMNRAAQITLRQAVNSKEVSFSSAASLGERFSHFVLYAKGHGVGRMERMNADLVRQYGQELATKVLEGDMRPSTAQNYVSAINTVLSIAGGNNWKSVSPCRECGIPERSFIRHDATVERSVSSVAIMQMRENGLERQAVIAELARNLGLRSKEASLLNANKALEEAKASNAITVSDGTKGGRDRIVPITTAQQIESLERASTIQGGGRAVMPVDKNWKEWREGGLRSGRDELHQYGIKGYHELRAEYAAERYAVLVGHPAPVNGGVINDRNADLAARQQIAVEMGHGRIDIVSTYIGGR